MRWVQLPSPPPCYLFTITYRIYKRARSCGFQSGEINHSERTSPAVAECRVARNRTDKARKSRHLRHGQVASNGVLPRGPDYVRLVLIATAMCGAHLQTG